MKDCINCLWNDQCGELCGGQCDDYSPIDEELSSITYYELMLMESVDEYASVAAEYGDGNQEEYDD